MSGLGVIVDYAVFIISRYPQEQMRDETPVAIQRALTTLGRAVFFFWSGAVNLGL
ncbi:MMPL family transporter [Sulfobacillus sp. hq2]|uniref:MMPL family transporter n=1 Tax=Sulfobacillus TaxID=28033 RepID=UPI001FA900FD|nr:MMPL family transporter [Sulfobacillus sp. hq2]